MTSQNSNKGKIKVTKNGPYLVSGGLPLKKEIIIVDDEHCPVKWQTGKEYPVEETYALCRCGKSSNKPFCDGTHAKTGFTCRDADTQDKYDDQAQKIEGPDLVLKDLPKLCSAARFCHRQAGTWNLTMDSNNPASKKTAIEEANDCPSGRLKACDKKTGQPIENKREPEISVVEDPDQQVSGPLWVKGKVPIKSSDGKPYEKRNRVTLCRCGKSGNKPYCDGSHIDAGFDDGDESLRS
jgi:CDGSH-type Zn-finger protein